MGPFADAQNTNREEGALDEVSLTSRSSNACVTPYCKANPVPLLANVHEADLDPIFDFIYTSRDPRNILTWRRMHQINYSFDQYGLKLRVQVY